MKSLKRIASLLMVAALVFQITTVMAAPMPEDVIGTPYETAVRLLSALDIMVGDGESFKAEDNVTRAEFAKILVNSMGLGDAVESYQPVGMFEDVPTSDVLAPMVELGNKIGAIQGYGDGYFGPDDDVTGEQAVKMMVYATGHNISAELAGGYPAGYLMTAADLGLLRGVISPGFDMTQPLTRGKAAVLCYNALRVDVLQKISYGAEVTYVTRIGENLLTLKHNVYFADGLVTMNGVTALDNTSTIRKDAVKIQGKTEDIYLVGETDIANKLGTYVRVFYKLDPNTDDKTIVSYEILESKNEIIRVPLSNLVAGSYDNVMGSGDARYRAVAYWENKETDFRPREIKVKFMPSIIYNGTSTIDFDFNKTIKLQGDMTIIDNDSDGIFDLLYVTAYDNYVVSIIDKSEYVITDKYGYYDGTSESAKVKSVKLDLDDSDHIVTIVDENGKDVAFSSLKEWNVLSVAQSNQDSGRRLTNVIVSTNTVEGEITEIATVGGHIIVKVGEEEYQLAPNYENYITKGGTVSDFATLRVGYTSTFYLDAFGKIAASKITATSGDANFGLLVKVNRSASGLDDAVRLKIYSDGELKTYLTAPRVTVDGVICRNADTAFTEIDRSLRAADVYPTGGDACPLLFKVNEEGQIIFIDTPNYNESIESPYSLYPKNQNFEKCTYRGSMMGMQNPISPTAQFIEIPPLYEDTSSADNMKSYGTSNLISANNDDNQYDVRLYVTEVGGYVSEYGLIRTEGGTSEYFSDSHDLQFFVVNYVTKCISPYSGEQTLKVYGFTEAAAREVVVKADYYQSGKLFKTLYTDFPDNSTPPSPERLASVFLPGDIIKYNTDSHQEIASIKPIFLSDVKLYRIESENRGVGGIFYRLITPAAVYRIDGNSVFLQRYTGGPLADANGEYILPQFSATSPDMLICSLSGFKIMVYDITRPVGEQVYVGTPADVTDSFTSAKPSIVIFQLRANGPRGMLVIKY